MYPAHRASVGWGTDQKPLTDRLLHIDGLSVECDERPGHGSKVKQDISDERTVSKLKPCRERHHSHDYGGHKHASTCNGRNASYPVNSSSQVANVHSPNLSKEKCISEVLTIGSIIMFQPSKL